MYVGLKQPRGDGERYVTPARAAAKETREILDTRLLHVKRCPCSLSGAKAFTFHFFQWLFFF